jgi:chloramphenicol 3-O phosphotransferase
LLLNGTTSAGKSSIAHELIALLDPPHFLMSIDAFHAMRAKKHYEEAHELAAMLDRTRAGFHRAVAAMAHAGNDIVMDYVFSEKWRLVDCLRLFDGLDVVFIGVKCDLAEVERREAVRGDREPGLARAQIRRVHEHGLYDITVHTDVMSAWEAAKAIVAELPGPGHPQAFERLRQRLTL